MWFRRKGERLGSTLSSTRNSGDLWPRSKVDGKLLGENIRSQGGFRPNQPNRILDTSRGDYTPPVRWWRVKNPIRYQELSAMERAGFWLY